MSQNVGVKLISKNSDFNLNRWFVKFFNQQIFIEGVFCSGKVDDRKKICLSSRAFKLAWMRTIHTKIMDSMKTHVINVCWMTVAFWESKSMGKGMHIWQWDEYSAKNEKFIMRSYKWKSRQVTL